MAPYVGVSLYTLGPDHRVPCRHQHWGYLGGNRDDISLLHAWLSFFSLAWGPFSIRADQLVGGAPISHEFDDTDLVDHRHHLFVSFLSPWNDLSFVVKLTLSNLEKAGNVVGKIYAFSPLASILGTFATGFYLISWMGPAPSF